MALTPKQAERRRRVIEAALQLAREGGYDAVQMRDVAAVANVALGTIYRYFSSKDHLLAAAMAEWTGELQVRLSQLPPRGDSPVDQLVDVFKRACRALERQPKLAASLITALSAADQGVHESSMQVRRQIGSMAAEILGPLDEETRGDIMSLLGHVWYSTLVGWANGRRTFSYVVEEIERAIRLVLRPYEAELLASGNGDRSRRRGAAVETA